MQASFRWQVSQSADWKYGQLTFVYDFPPQPDYAQLSSSRRPSAVQAARNLERRLHEEWERLKMQALFSLREFFRRGAMAALYLRCSRLDQVVMAEA